MEEVKSSHTLGNLRTGKWIRDEMFVDRGNRGSGMNGSGAKNAPFNLQLQMS